MGMEPFVAADDNAFGHLIASIPSPVDNFREALAFKTGIAQRQAQTQQAQAETANQMSKLGRAEQFQHDLAAVGANPNASAISGLILKYPEFAEQLKGGWDVKDKAARDADLTQTSEVYSAAANGHWDLALKQAQVRLEADKAAGQADDADQAMIDQIQAAAGGDEKAKKSVLAMLGLHLAASSGAEHFASVYGAVKGGYTLDAGATRYDNNDNPVAQSPFVKTADGGILERDAPAGTAAPQTPPANVPPGGPPDLTSPAASEVAASLTTAGLPAPVVAGFLGNLHIEGGYNGAKGDGGIASGIAQWHPDRLTNFEKVVGKPVAEASPDEQAKFITWEMQNPEAAGMTVGQRDAILNAKTPAQAAALIDQFYERSSGDDRQKRMAAADRFAGSLPAGATAAPPGYHWLTPPSSGDAPSGYRYKPDGSLETIPGGPADPNGVKNAGPLKPKALEAATIAYTKTGKMPAGMGGQNVRNQILNYLPNVMDRYGLTPDDVPAIQQSFAADSKAYGQRVGQLSYMRQSVGKLNQHAQDLSALIKAIPLQGNITPFNWITQGAEGAVSNSTLAQLRGGLPLFEGEVARIMTGNPNSGAGQLSDDARHEFDVLHSAQAPKAKIDAMNRIMKMVEESVKATRDETVSLKGKLGGGLDVYAGKAPEVQAQPGNQDGDWITLPSGLKIRKIK